MKEVYISIKPKFTHLIETKQKNYEFRKYFIKDLKTMFVYESENSCLKYIMEVGTPVMSPTQIEENGYGMMYLTEPMKRNMLIQFFI